MTMITTVVLLAVYAATTSSALKLSSPIHFARPLNDVHINCKLDVQELCSPIGTYIQEVPTTFTAYEITPEVLHQDAKEESNNARRLTEVDPKNASMSRQYSISVGLRIIPKNSEEKMVQRAKNNKRFLNYGPNADMCLWDAFDAQQISSQCASALMYLNDSDDSTPCHYDNDPNIQRVYSKVSITFSGGTLLVFVVLCLLINRMFSSNEDDDNGDDDKATNQLNSNHHEYQLLAGSGNEVFVAVPVQVV